MSECLTNIEKQLQQLSRKHLSLYGRVIILHTIILSKATFLNDIFPIPATTTNLYTNIIGNSQIDKL